MSELKNEPKLDQTVALLDLFYGEELLIKTLRKISDAVTAPGLYVALDQHLAETRQQRQRLLPILDNSQQAVEVIEPSVKKLTDEVDALLAEDVKSSGRAGLMPEREMQLIEITRRIEKHEIEHYQKAQALAEARGQANLAEHLQTSLAEEIYADQTLASLQAQAVLDEGIPE
jgi:ferritin-like metal-binding protein YciE